MILLIKERYEAPAMIVVMVETEGVIADSNNRESYGDAEEC